MIPSTGSKSLSTLVNQCQTDQQQRHEGSNACLTLFKKALVEQDNGAWEAITNQFYALVTHWVYRHTRFDAVQEEADIFVNDAFIRLWQYGGPRAKQGLFNHLGDYLSYLKRCTWSAIEDHLRKLRRDAIWYQTELDKVDVTATEEEEQDTTIALLFTLIEELTADNVQERAVAEETWLYGLPPRAIQEKYPDQFADTSAVHQVKRNVLRRLRRHPQIKQLIASMDQKVRQ